jgi:hypothetical protein
VPEDGEAHVPRSWRSPDDVPEAYVPAFTPRRIEAARQASLGMAVTDQEAVPTWPAAIAAALRDVGSRSSALTHRQTDLGGWVTEWEGEVEGDEIYVQAFYGHPDVSPGEIRIGGWIFEDVRVEGVRELIRTVIHGDVRLRRSLFGSWKLTASAPDAEYSTSDRDPGPVPDSDWERRAVERGGHKS